MARLNDSMTKIERSFSELLNEKAEKQQQRIIKLEFKKILLDSFKNLENDGTTRLLLYQEKDFFIDSIAKHIQNITIKVEKVFNTDSETEKKYNFDLYYIIDILDGLYFPTLKEYELTNNKIVKLQELEAIQNIKEFMLEHIRQNKRKYTMNVIMIHLSKAESKAIVLNILTSTQKDRLMYSRVYHKALSEIKSEYQGNIALEKKQKVKMPFFLRMMVGYKALKGLFKI